MFILVVCVSSVTEFSKKTGDYPSLSATDIKVLALTYQLELEHVGSRHLKKEPEVKVPDQKTTFTVCTDPSQLIACRTDLVLTVCMFYGLAD